uniref:Uncharacterized protein n=1 Tax=Rhizophora mucronata TaxID=61149 RepID=A0A2P2QAE6_RHIMU
MEPDYLQKFQLLPREPNPTLKH